MTPPHILITLFINPLINHYPSIYLLIYYTLYPLTKTHLNYSLIYIINHLPFIIQSIITSLTNFLIPLPTIPFILITTYILVIMFTFIIILPYTYLPNFHTHLF